MRHESQFSVFGVSCQYSFGISEIPVFLSQSGVAAGVKSFENPNNLHFRVINSLRTPCVKAFRVLVLLYHDAAVAFSWF